MYVIHRYQVKVTSLQTIQMPENAEILALQEQGGLFYVWAGHTETPLKPRVIAMVGTGHKVAAKPGKYIGTVQYGGFAWHYFEAHQ